MRRKVEIVEGRILSPYEEAHITGQFELIPWKNKTSTAQRKYYWGVLVKTVADYTGYTADETHGKFGWLTRKEETKGIPRIRSIMELTTAEMEEKNEEIRRYFADKLSLVIPDPNQIDYNQIEV